MKQQQQQHSGVFELVKDFTIGRKIGLIVVMMAIPIAFLTVLFIKTKNVQVDTAKYELVGVEYLTPVRALLETVPQHRGIVSGFLNGDTSLRSRAEGLQQTIDRQFATLEATNQRLALEGVGDKVGSVKRSWSDLKVNALRVTPKDSLDSHNRLVIEIIELVRLVADRSNLTVDPKVETYNLIDAVVTQLPSITDKMSRVGALVGGAARKAGLAPEDQVRIQAYAENVESAIQSVQREFGSVFTAKPGLEPKINPSLLAAARQGDSLLRPLKEGTFDKSDRAFDTATTAIGGFFALYDSTLSSLRELLDERIQELRRDQWLQLSIVGGIVFLAIVLVSLISGGVGRQIGSISDVFGEIGNGNYEVRVPVNSKDELGSMAASLNAVLDNTLTLVQSRDERNRIQQSIQKLLDDISGLASGDLTQEAEVTAEITGAIADSFNYMIAELRQLVSSVNHTTAQVGESAREVLNTTDQLAQGSEGQARRIAETSQSIQEMVSSIRQVSQTATQASSVAEQAFQKAKQGAEAVHQTIEGMNGIRNQVQETSKRLKGLGERSQEIGQIVQLIGDVADRTSILALNASIQAAMAGEAGRGFAVVAEEVERLADRAAEATKKVNALIKSIQADTTEAITAMEDTTKEVVAGSNLANAAGRTLSEIESVSNQLTTLIQSITTASEEQAQGSDLIAQSMTEISAVTVETAEGAKQAAQSVQQLAALADELRSSLQRFRLPADEPTYTSR